MWIKCPDCKREHLGRNIFGTPPDRYCDDCHRAKRPDAFDSTRGLRCPKCGDMDRDDLWEHGGIYEEGEHEVSCVNCGHDFQVETSVEITWTSPPRLK